MYLAVLYQSTFLFYYVFVKMEEMLKRRQHIMVNCRCHTITYYYWQENAESIGQ